MKISLIESADLVAELRKRGYYVSSKPPTAGEARRTAIEAIRKEAYRRTNSDEQAAEVLGMNVNSFYVWRKNIGLPKKSGG